MNQNRFFLDAGLFTDAAGAEDLYGNALRSGMQYDSYGDNLEFDVVVLTQPVPLAGADAGMVIGQNFIPSHERGFDNETGDEDIDTKVGTLGSISFKGRIVGGEAMSPHASLPDPCNMSLATDVGSILKIINLHTTFVSAGGYTGAIPTVGETVRVKMQQGDFKFNLQYAMFTEIMNPGAGNAVTNAMGDECTSLRDRFGRFDITQDLGDITQIAINMGDEGPHGPGITQAEVQDYIDAIKPEIQAQLGYTLLGTNKCGIPSDFPGIPDDIKARYPVADCVTRVIGNRASGDGMSACRTTGHPVFLDTLQEIHNAAITQGWWNELKTANNNIDPILYSSGYRTLDTQIYLRMKKCSARNVQEIMMRGNSNCSPPVAPPGYSRHNLGLAIDYGGIMGARGQLSQPPSRWLRALQRNTAPDGGNGTYYIKRYSAEEWHYSIDGS